MKKFLSILMAIVFAFSLTACGDNSTESKDDTTPTNVSTEQATDSAEWKQFIKDYDAFVDDYLDILEKYKNNPTDTTILADYNSMLPKVTEWSEKAEKITEELQVSPEDASEFAAELSKIANKLADAVK